MRLQDLADFMRGVKIDKEMDNLSISDESSSDLGYHPSPSYMDQTDHSATETTGYSPMAGRDSFAYCRTSSQTSAFSEPTDETIYSSSPSPSRWSTNHPQPVLSRLGMKQFMHKVDNNTSDQEVSDPELEMMKERFSKLLLGEDMSGSGKGVCTAVTISNAITNLYATVFGQGLRLEPLKPETKSLWKREMDCLLSVCDYIVEFIPGSQNLRDGSTVEVMISAPRGDIYINLPALKKLDAMLLEILEGFVEPEFWYAEQGRMSMSSTRSGSFRRVVQRNEEKWWVPVPCVPPGGLSERSKKHLQHKCDAANQIHKAAMTINSSVLAEMEIPDSYIAGLPKSGKSCLGDQIYRYMWNAEKFSPDQLLDRLNLSSEHEALDLADRVEASMYTWRRKACISHSKSSWDLVKDHFLETNKSDKNHMMAERAEGLLFCLKQRYPELSQTSLDTCKIQCNTDIGQAILESYSRVLEGLAFNIVAWIEDVLFADVSMRSQEE